MKKKRNTLSLILSAAFFLMGIGLYIGSRTAFNAVNAEPEEGYTSSGTCGTSANWYYYADSQKLLITGSGTIQKSNSWNTSTKTVVVEKGITEISNGTFRSLTNLKSITLPFVGASRTATGPSATFGYIFGYATSSSFDQSMGSSNTYTYKGLFPADSTSYTGYFSTKYSNGNVAYTANGTTYSEIGWETTSYAHYDSSSPFTYSNATKFINYRVGAGYDSYTSSKVTTFSSPANTTWQYSCNDYEYAYSSSIHYWFLQSYYYYIPSSLTKVSITDASKIETAAFMNCTNITELNLNNTITSVGDYAFKNCQNIDVFDLPTGLTSLGSYAMYNCSKITDLIIPNNVTTVSDYCFYGCTSLSEIKFSPNVTTISSYAFHGCTSLRDVILSEKTKAIGDHAFYNNDAFKKIVIPNSVTTIGDYAFYGCNAVTSVRFGNKITSIGSFAFAYLSTIESIYVPKNVTSIGAGAFRGCTALKSITLPFVGASRTATGPSATFGYIFGYATSSSFDQSMGSSNTYTYKGLFPADSTSYTGYFSTKYSNGNVAYTANGTTYSEIGWETTSYAHYDSSSPFTYSNATKFINYRVGAGYDSYTSSKVTTFSSPANTTWQYSCNDYEYAYSSSIHYWFLQSYYYYIPSSLTKVSITDASKIETAAFMNCTNITELNLNNTITSVGDYAFKNLGYVTQSQDEFVISGNVLLAYKGSSSTVNIPEGVEIIAPRAFYNKTSITTVNVSKTVTFIGDYAFYNCTKAKINVPKISGSLTIGSNVSSNGITYLTKYSYTNSNDTFYYTKDSNNNLTIVGCSTTSTNLTLPVTISDNPVIAVGYKGMANCTTLTSVTIPSNIISLDLYSFYGCTNLTTVTIPSTCTHVGDYAFRGCTKLHSVTIAEGVTYIGKSAFYGCTSLSEIVIPDTCTFLGSYAFYNCTSLQSASIGILVPDVNDYTFYNCTSLSSVVLGTSIQTIGDYAFYKTAITRVATPATLVSIGDYAYAECSSLTKVTLRNGFETLGEGAFYDCLVLNSINLVSSIEDIGSYAFYNCQSLTSVTIPALITEINDYTFYNCTSISSVTINGSVVRIGDQAFYNNALESFDFGESLDTIGYNAFKDNDLSSITLPDTTNSIGEQAFDGNDSLNTISMPDDVGYVGAYAFPRGVNNQTFTIRYHTGTISDDILFNTDSHKVIMEEGITSIGNYAFAHNNVLAEIVFPSTLKNIGNYAFYENRNYEEITLPSNVKTIGSNAFARGYILSKITMPDSVTSIGDNCFSRYEDKYVTRYFTVEFYYNNGEICSELLRNQSVDKIIVDDQIYSIKTYAFANISALDTVSLPDTISNFESNVFYSDNTISLTIRRCDGYIDNSVFKGDLVTAINLFVENTEVGISSFENCSGLKKVTISGDVDINGRGFYNSGVQTLTIQDETNVGDYAFASCTSLNTASINDSPSIGNYAFYNCNVMTTFTINGEVETIGAHAFDSCKALTAMALPSTVNYVVYSLL